MYEQFDIPLEQMTKDERMGYLKRKVQTFTLFSTNREIRNKDILPNEHLTYSRVRELWNGGFDKERYKSLRDTYVKEECDEINLTDSEIIEMGMPAEIEHIPILKSRLQVLITKEKRQPFKPQIVAIDDKSLERKTKDLIDAIDSFNEKELAVSNKAYEQIKQLEQLLETMVQQAQQEQQQNQSSNPETLAEIKKVNEQLQNLRNLKSNYDRYDEDKLKTIYRNRQHSYRDAIEVMCGKLFEVYRNQHNLDKLFNMGMEEFIQTDEEIYYVSYEQAAVDPEVRLVRPENIHYFISDNNYLLEDADFVCERVPMTKPEIRARLSRYMNNEDYDSLENTWLRTNYDSFMSEYDFLPDGQMVHNDFNQSYPSDASQKYDVHHVFWKEKSIIYTLWKKKEITDESDFDEQYDFDSFLTVEEYKKIKNKLKKSQQIRRSYRNDLFEAWVVHQNHIIAMRKVKEAIRPIYNPMEVKLPYVGYGYNRFNKPDALFQKCIPLQDNYNILEYKEKLVYVLSGVAGIVFDKDMMPAGMTWAEWFHKRKQGVIPTAKFKNNTRQFTDNQLQTYDDTLPATIGNYAIAKENIIRTIALITGVNDQSLGNISDASMVGNNQLALEQSELIMQFYFQRHDFLKTKVVERLCNLFPQAYKKGKRGNFLIGNRQEILNINPGSLDGAFQVFIRSSEEEVKTLNLIRQIAEKQAMEGALPLSTYVDLLNNDIIADAKYIIDQAQVKSQLLQEKQQQQLQDQQEAAEKRIRELDAEMQMRITKQQGDQLMKLEKIKGDLQIQKEKIKAELDFKKQMLIQTSNQNNTQSQINAINNQTTSKEDIEKKKLELDEQIKKDELALERQKLESENLLRTLELKAKINKPQNLN